MKKSAFNLAAVTVHQEPPDVATVGCSRKYWGWQVKLGNHISPLPTDRNRKGGAANLRRFLVYLL